MSFAARRQLRLSASSSVIENAVALVVSTLNGCGADDDAVQCIAMAVTEAVGNAVRHAMPFGATHLEISCAVVNGAAIVEVVDYGPGFDFVRRPMPEPCAEDGRGIPLMLTVCDDVRYHASPDGNRLLMRKELRSSRAS